MKKLKVNESQYIVLFVVSRSIKNLLLIDFANIYIFSIFFSMYIARSKSVGLPPHCFYGDSLTLTHSENNLI